MLNTYNSIKLSFANNIIAASIQNNRLADNDLKKINVNINISLPKNESPKRIFKYI